MPVGKNMTETFTFRMTLRPCLLCRKTPVKLSNVLVKRYASEHADESGKLCEPCAEKIKDDPNAKLLLLLEHKIEIVGEEYKL